MSDQFNRRTSKGTRPRKPRVAKPGKDPDLEGRKEPPPREQEEAEQSPLKTVGGTPIIQRENG
jgi:hypothetical protein